VDWYPPAVYERCTLRFLFPEKTPAFGTTAAGSNTMMPGGHLATSVALSAAAWTSTGSPALAAGCLAGGFLIDCDHYLDYLLFEGQWRRPGPSSFLNYYFSRVPLRVVLPLHSLELMSVLAVLCYVRPEPLLAGYLAGAGMHLVFDILVNGSHVLRSPVLFYCFAYRARHRFSSARMMDPITIPPEAALQPWRGFFFKWIPWIQRSPKESLEKDSIGVS
jgi:hypothetical protein